GRAAVDEGRRAPAPRAAARDRCRGGSATRRHGEAPALQAPRPRRGAAVTVEHAHTLRVRWSEADPAGIVFYPRFFEWFDLATEALFESIGLPWPGIFPKARVVGLPTVEPGARLARR